MTTLRITDIVLLGSLLTSSYTFWCNIGNGVNGIMPLIQGRLGHFDIPIAQKVKAWEKATQGGHKAYVPSAFLTFSLNFASAYFTQHRPLHRQILLTAGALGVAFIPYSIFVVHPTMDKLKFMDQRHELLGKDDDSPEARRAYGLMSDWEGLQAIRTGLFGVIWALNVWALLLQGIKL